MEKCLDNPAKQPQAVCMAQYAFMSKNTAALLRKIAPYTLCLDFRHFFKAGGSIVRA
jgi:hypothetical protein